jgi:hypothetical protein
MKVLRRQLEQIGWGSLHTRWIIRKRLANYYRTAGDQARPRSLGEAWRHYLRSLCVRPFDPVVVARTLAWPFRMLVGERGTPESTV